MSNNTMLHRQPGDERDRLPQSPTQQTTFYSPTSRAAPAPLPLQHPNHNSIHPSPTSPSTTTLPPISSALFSRDPPASKYYDPLSDRGDRTVELPGSRYEGHPAQPPYGQSETRMMDAHYDSYRSPVTANFPHHSPVQRPSSRHQHAASMDHMSQSPVSPSASREFSKPPPSRPNDPMSISNIMSGNDPEPPRSNTHYSRPSSKSSAVPPAPIKDEVMPPMAPSDIPPASRPNGQPHADPYMVNGGSAIHHAPVQPNVPMPDEKDVELEVQRIEATEHAVADDLDNAAGKAHYLEKCLKRKAAADSLESTKRKIRRTANIKRHLDLFYRHNMLGSQRFNQEHAQEAWEEVQQMEIAEEKERKKDMQRKRRREKTIQNEQQKKMEALEKAQYAQDEVEREKLLREAQKAEKKANATNALLQGVTPSKDFREVTPHGPNYEGGTMSTFQTSEDAAAPRESGSGRGGRVKRAGNRPRKSKEQKQAEKDAAAAAHAAIERGEDLPTILPKFEDRGYDRLEMLKRERSATEDSTPAAVPTTNPFESKAYDQLYAQIWRDLAKKDVPKVWRIKDNSLATRQSNLRKTAQLASKEARRWQIRTNKSMKDVQARAKRSMREMLSFWKRNERDERDQRKMAEKQELENAKKAEAEREANRQKRKLNFLISQTELYSHFIGKKVKTDEVERSTDDVAASEQTVRPGPTGAHTIDLPPSVAKVGTKVTNFEDLDFDAEDESALQEAAMANAQNAVQEAQDRARAFNNDGSNQMSDFDDGEMNFQNPSSLQTVDVEQPKMLSCQLKEYQLKGLNWLVNLYEQGINGILADEMGLGKTVQSISVMAYLAEVHNIWGPFLVVAPSSTLHNWEQEIRKFVPGMKVLPYWGTAKDRKVLRKIWDRKHITYTKETDFHVLITSYQLVVQDMQYFQKMRWQYMILDEAQAIKSSQSSRWKALLGFHCRNRLLLTGTPIQNNMQELWALLHFIMPSLFDSHDEFSDWFSKDIESHAQSNTKLNEDQLKRLHMILKPFMLRRVKKHVQKELGDKVEKDIFCDLTYRQRAYYSNLRNRISIMDLIEKAAIGDDQDAATLMNLVMQFRKVCNHPDLFERADTSSPFSFSSWAETASFMREGLNINVSYSVRNDIQYTIPKTIYHRGGRLDLPGPQNEKAGFKAMWIDQLMNVWAPGNMARSLTFSQPPSKAASKANDTFSFLRFADLSASEASSIARSNIFERAVALKQKRSHLGRFSVLEDEEQDYPAPVHAMFNIVERNSRQPLAEVATEGRLASLMNIAKARLDDEGLRTVESCARPSATAPPIDVYCGTQNAVFENQRDFFNPAIRHALFSNNDKTEQAIIDMKVDPATLPPTGMLPPPDSLTSRYTHISVPSMRRFVTDSGKLAKLDQLLRELKEGGHRVLLYFQMTRMIDLMEEYLTYRNYKFCRLDGSTKIEDRRDMVADFQTKPEIFIFLLSTRAGGLGINLTSADTVIFYDSDWNPTIDSQAMDRAHRLGQTRQVTVYRMITRGTIEERIRKRALQKEEVQRVVISGGAGASIDFNTRSRENRTKDIAMWLADDDQAEAIEKREAEVAAAEASGQLSKKKAKGGRKKEVTMDDIYHEGEGNFADESNKPSGAATPMSGADTPAGGPGKGKGKKGKGMSKKAKTLQQRLAVADGNVEADLKME